MAAVAPYIPVTDSGYDSWLLNFSTLITATPPLYGLTAGQALIIANSYASWHAAYLPMLSPSTKTAAAVALKVSAKVNSQAIVRPFAQQIALSPGVSSGDKVALGLNPRTSMPAPITPPDSNPVLTVQSAGALSMIMRYRDSSGSVKVKAKPYGVTRCRLRVAYSATIALRISNPELAAFFADLTKSPTTLVFDSSVGGQVATFWAQWVTRTGGVSPWSPAVSFTVPIAG